jgi:L-alanine-DL-glutamate epimerase-like enolase superfamily enzyme
MYDVANYHGFAGAEMRAISAIDIALWDILGQYSGQPIYQLLGGKTHDSVKIYNTCISYGNIRDREGFMQDAGNLAKDLIQQGIMGMKIWPLDAYSEQSRGQSISYTDLLKGIDPVRMIREAVGRDMEIALECHSRWNLPTAIRIAKELSQYDIKWLEDPVPIDDVNVIARLRHAVDVPILASERLFTRGQYKPLLEADAVDIIMCDIGWTGGFTEMKKIATMAESYRIPITTHNCGGPIMTIASGHICINLPNSIGTETVRAFYNTFYEHLTDDKINIKNGQLFIDETPGLGVKLKPELFERQDLIRERTGENKKLIFASSGDPWAQSPGDAQAKKYV